MTTEPGLRAEAADLETVRDWFAKLTAQVRAKDFEGAYPLFLDDFLAFGTVAAFEPGRESAERNQWRHVWTFIEDFQFRLDDVRAFVSPDRLFAMGLGIFDSTGFHEDGTPYPRSGRATVGLERKSVDEPWVANHTHMSLFSGTPPRSYGKKG
ncbi:nuclear transport factor 2 family protein [Kaistia dalseonensis]|uniref:Ketosteroid isomerase-like protein n=1 Tax=Kaistia dalseonensis TaxID=410840 RepID=A0ABU0H8T2_9HYPH|nr:nuclear transport factor 2 family protein [Kaistia dalseonensis]MCX5496116.1 nuclear transport factor 2 family protein [Kaistia dalseonensis]MDQ0438723.1 ketosteroid isomerase-like protein [Kaistia dalseonensis]